jgi:hypothetical protein
MTCLGSRSPFQERESASNPSVIVEARPGGIVVVSLGNSTRATQKGLYHKTKHGFDLFGLIDPNMVMRNPPFPDELVKLLLAKSD